MTKDDVVVVIFHDHGTRYLAKMFNDEWMKDRGFLVKEQPKAIDLIRYHQHEPLITLSEELPVQSAIEKMAKYNVSQIPITRGETIIGALNDTHLFARLMEDPSLRNQPILSVIQPPFPMVQPEDSLEVVSKKLTKDNPAVLVNDEKGKTHIITRQDVIAALG